MTHDELLVKLFHAEFHETYKALRAVVELHKPDSTYNEHCDECESVAGDGGDAVKYPCPTIQAIEEQLK